MKTPRPAPFLSEILAVTTFSLGGAAFFVSGYLASYQLSAHLGDVYTAWVPAGISLGIIFLLSKLTLLLSLPWQRGLPRSLRWTYRLVTGLLCLLTLWLASSHLVYRWTVAPVAAIRAQYTASFSAERETCLDCPPAEVAACLERVQRTETQIVAAIDPRHHAPDPIRASYQRVQALGSWLTFTRYCHSLALLLALALELCLITGLETGIQLLAPPSSSAFKS